MLRSRAACNQLVVFLVVLYAILYCVVMFIVLRPEHREHHFVGNEHRVGEQYVLIYLLSDTDVFSDAEGAEVFARRRSKEKCFLTNNRGFSPLEEYDAVAVLRDHGRGEAPLVASVNPDRLYRMDSDEVCLRKKLVGCANEPLVSSCVTDEEYNLMELCRFLHEQRRRKSSDVNHT